MINIGLSRIEYFVSYIPRYDIIILITALSRSLDPLKDQLHNTLAQKLTATDSLLRESIPKLVKSKVDRPSMNNIS